MSIRTEKISNREQIQEIKNNQGHFITNYPCLNFWQVQLSLIHLGQGCQRYGPQDRSSPWSCSIQLARLSQVGDVANSGHSLLPYLGPWCTRPLSAGRWSGAVQHSPGSQCGHLAHCSLHCLCHSKWLLGPQWSAPLLPRDRCHCCHLPMLGAGSGPQGDPQSASSQGPQAGAN